MMTQLRYQRVLLKLSGETLCQPGQTGVDTEAISSLAGEIASAVSLGVQLAIVVGGGNFLRGKMLADNPHIQRVTADYMGMLATTMNAIALRDALESHGLASEVLGAIDIAGVCDHMDIRTARQLLDSGVVVILAGGTGRPFVTTDTCAAIRACEVGADAVLKGTKVDGIYDTDPMTDPNAKRYETLTYEEALAAKLGVMDLTAFSLCMDHKMTIVVFNLTTAGNLRAVLTGENVGTVVSQQE